MKKETETHRNWTAQECHLKTAQECDSKTPKLKAKTKTINMAILTTKAAIHLKMTAI